MAPNPGARALLKVEEEDLGRPFWGPGDDKVDNNDGEANPDDQVKERKLDVLEGEGDDDDEVAKFYQVEPEVQGPTQGSER